MASAGTSEAHGVLAVLLASRFAPQSSVRVLDFGGACGVHAHRMQRLLGPSAAQLTWVIVETPSMAARARRLGCRAVASLPEAVELLGAVDLVHTAGAVQYTPDPSAVLAALLTLRAPVFLLTRGVATIGAREFAVVQESRLADNGPGPLPAGFQDTCVTNPVVFMRRDVLLEQIRAAYRRAVVLPDASGLFTAPTPYPVVGFAVCAWEPR